MAALDATMVPVSSGAEAEAGTETEAAAVSVAETVAVAATGTETVHPSAPAFWSALGVPASSDRRGRAGDDWRVCDHADRTPPASF